MKGKLVSMDFQAEAVREEKSAFRSPLDESRSSAEKSGWRSASDLFLRRSLANQSRIAAGMALRVERKEERWEAMMWSGLESSLGSMMR